MTRLMAVRAFPDRPAAEAAKARLTAAGIEALVAADDAGGWQPGQPFVRGVRVLVDADDVAHARQVLGGPGE